eukprot:scaffold215592_cov18-Tisochrysis_lutea.AAC.1
METGGHCGLHAWRHGVWTRSRLEVCTDVKKVVTATRIPRHKVCGPAEGIKMKKGGHCGLHGWQHGAWTCSQLEECSLRKEVGK